MPITWHSGAEIDRAKRAALQLIDEFGISEPKEIDLRAIAYCKGVRVREARMKGSEARLLRQNGRGIISVRKDVTNLGRRRLAIAHELGHWILHPSMTQWWVCSTDDVQGYAGNDQEIEANTFAAELVMPTPMLRPYCQQGTFGFSLIERISKMFSTSLTATALRVVEESPEQCCVVVSDADRVRWSWRSHKLPEYAFHVPRKFVLGDETRAWWCGMEERMPKGKVPVSAWFPLLPDDGRYEVWEESRYFEAYDSVLTLLIINEH